MTALAATPEHPSFADQFKVLAERWKAETTVISSTTEMTTHPAYQTIIALGPAVLPLLLRDLAKEPAHWFEALQTISGEDPVLREHWGDISAMQADWLAWGWRRGLV